MAAFKELDPALHLKLIEGYTDELSGESVKLEAFYRMHSKCKRCGSTLHKEFDARHAFGDEPLARALLRCGECNFLIEPVTGLILDSGSPSKIPTADTPYHIKPL